MERVSPRGTLQATRRRNREGESSGDNSDNQTRQRVRKTRLRTCAPRRSSRSQQHEFLGAGEFAHVSPRRDALSESGSAVSDIYVVRTWVRSGKYPYVVRAFRFADASCTAPKPAGTMTGPILGPDKGHSARQDVTDKEVATPRTAWSAYSIPGSSSSRRQM